MRLVFILACLIASLIAAYYGQPLVRDNTDAVTVMITVITVFAGFLVAIITILGDPAMVPKGSWRKAEIRHRNLESILIRQTWLFYCYLVAIGLLFAGVLIRKEPHDVVSDRLKAWIEAGYLFFGVFSFLLTLALPRALSRIQLMRSSAEIEDRRQAEGINRPAS